MKRPRRITFDAALQNRRTAISKMLPASSLFRIILLCSPAAAPRLHLIFDRRPLYFVTICVRRRLPALAKDPGHKALESFANRGLEEKQIATGRYVIMPDHLHVFVCGPPEFNLEQWDRTLKLALGRRPKMGLLGHFAEASLHPNSGSGVCLIMSYETPRVTQRNGNMFVTTRCEQVWSSGPKIGHIKEKLSKFGSVSWP